MSPFPATTRKSSGPDHPKARRYGTAAIALTYLVLSISALASSVLKSQYTLANSQMYRVATPAVVHYVLLAVLFVWLYCVLLKWPRNSAHTE
jgi:hypothetical protein